MTSFVCRSSLLRRSFCRRESVTLAVSVGGNVRSSFDRAFVFDAQLFGLFKPTSGNSLNSVLMWTNDNLLGPQLHRQATALPLGTDKVIHEALLYVERDDEQRLITSCHDAPNGEPSSFKFLNAIRSAKTDVLIVVFTNHGDPDGLYQCQIETEWGDLIEDVTDWDDIGDAIRDCGARKVIAIFDACDTDRATSLVDTGTQSGKEVSCLFAVGTVPSMCLIPDRKRVSIHASLKGKDSVALGGFLATVALAALSGASEAECNVLFNRVHYAVAAVLPGTELCDEGGALAALRSIAPFLDSPAVRKYTSCLGDRTLYAVGPDGKNSFKESWFYLQLEYGMSVTTFRQASLVKTFMVPVLARWGKQTPAENSDARLALVKELKRLAREHHCMDLVTLATGKGGVRECVEARKDQYRALVAGCGMDRAVWLLRVYAHGDVTWTNLQTIRPLGKKVLVFSHGWLTTPLEAVVEFVQFLRLLGAEAGDWDMVFVQWDSMQCSPTAAALPYGRRAEASLYQLDALPSVDEVCDNIGRRFGATNTPPTLPTEADLVGDEGDSPSPSMPTGVAAAKSSSARTSLGKDAYRYGTYRASFADVKERAYAIGTTLAASIYERVDSDAEVVFVGHSFGSIVASQAALQLALCRQSEDSTDVPLRRGSGVRVALLQPAISRAAFEDGGLLAELPSAVDRLAYSVYRKDAVLAAYQSHVMTFAKSHPHAARFLRDSENANVSQDSLLPVGWVGGSGMLPSASSKALTRPWNVASRGHEGWTCGQCAAIVNDLIQAPQ